MNIIYNTMAKQKAIQGQTIIYEIQCRNMKIEKRESPKTGVNFGAHEGKSVPVPLVSSVVLLLLASGDNS